MINFMLSKIDDDRYGCYRQYKKLEIIKLVISKSGALCSIYKTVENNRNDELIFKINTGENSYLTELHKEFSHTTYIYEAISIYWSIYRSSYQSTIYLFFYSSLMHFVPTSVSHSLSSFPHLHPLPYPLTQIK